MADKPVDSAGPVTPKGDNSNEPMPTRFSRVLSHSLGVVLEMHMLGQISGGEARVLLVGCRVWIIDSREV